MPMSDTGNDPASPQRPTLLGKLREELAVRHYARRTEKSHVLWVRRYLTFHDRRGECRWCRPGERLR
jgi:hypothetical protein